MFKLACNLTFMFTETPFLERFARAKTAGFDFVEFHNPFPYSENVKKIQAEAKANGLEIIHFNLPAGDWDAGDRGIAAWPDRVDEFRSGVDGAIEIAKELGCRQINCPVGYTRPYYSPEAQQKQLVENLRWAARRLATASIVLLIEPLNPITHPGYLLINTAQAVELQDAVNHPNLKIQYDYYQMQRSEGELAETVSKNLDRIGFIQLADNPGRGQPGTGEINYKYLLNQLSKLPFSGYLSLEYTPIGATEDSFGWLTEYGITL